jgi:hypothetical protein
MAGESDEMRGGENEIILGDGDSVCGHEVVEVVEVVEVL